MEVNFATLPARGSGMERRRTGHPFDARAVDGLFEIDAGSETIARKIFAGFDACRN